MKSFSDYRQDLEDINDKLEELRPKLTKATRLHRKHKADFQSIEAEAVIELRSDTSVAKPTEKDKEAAAIEAAKLVDMSEDGNNLWEVFNYWKGEEEALKSEVSNYDIRRSNIQSILKAGKVSAS